jgi:hypothetical protein
MKDPILWFLIVGAILFAGDSYFTAERESIVVDDQVKGRLNSLWQAQMGSPTTPEQLTSLVDAWVREEVMLREALRRAYRLKALQVHPDKSSDNAATAKFQALHREYLYLKDWFRKGCVAL